MAIELQKDLESDKNLYPELNNALIGMGKNSSASMYR
jgi:hypothetical protein